MTCATCAGTGRGFTTKKTASGAEAIDRYHPCRDCQPAPQMITPRRSMIVGSPWLVP